MALGGYAGLFLISFLAATILPAQSELSLTALHLTGNFSLFWLVAVASLGNTLGAVVNWFLGRGVEQFKNRTWFPVKPEQLDQAQKWYLKYGWPSLFLSWVPIIGDPITFAAGIMREPIGRFFVVVAIAKTLRYVVVAMLLLSV